MGNKNLETVDITADLPAIRISKEDIRKHFCPLATELEVVLGLAIIKSLKLNPFLREVHFIKYSPKDKMAIVVGYEVYLKRAERTGKLNGWAAGINTAENYAWVKIHRKDWAEPFEWTVNLEEFNKKQSTWNQIPSFMGRKVAIAQGFRLCFPDELGGLPYTEEEHQVYDINTSEPSGKPEVSMPTPLPAQAPDEGPTPEPSENTPFPAEEPKPDIITDKQQKLLFAKCRDKKIAIEVFKAHLKGSYGIEHTKEIAKEWMDDLLRWIDEQ